MATVVRVRHNSDVCVKAANAMLRGSKKRSEERAAPFCCPLELLVGRVVYGFIYMTTISMVALQLIA